MEKPTFEASLPEINRILQSRRSAWTYTSVSPWEDVSQEILKRLIEKWDKFDPNKGPLENWLNRFISNAIQNEKRDRGGNRWQRPCVGGGRSNGRSCTFNTGGDTCSYTKSGKQCTECPLYAEWAKSRQHQFNIKSTVALENHAQEVSNTQGDFFDVAAVEQEMHRQMKENLTQWEYRLYHCLYIQHLSASETGTVLEAVVKQWKRAPREEEQFSYQFILSKQRWFKELMYDCLKREGYDLKTFLNHDR